MVENIKIMIHCETLVIGFADENERSKFLDLLKACYSGLKDGYMSTDTFFSLLGFRHKDPYAGDNLAWSIHEIESCIFHNEPDIPLAENGYWLVLPCHPHKKEEWQKLIMEKIPCEIYVDTSQESFTIAFQTKDDRADVDKFIFFMLKRYGYISSKDLFNLLKRVDPFENPEYLYGWKKADFDDQIFGESNKRNDFRYLAVFKNPKIVSVQQQESDQKTITTENGLLIIYSDIFMKQENYYGMYKNLLNEMKSGLVLLQPYLHAKYIPAGTTIKIENGKDEWLCIK